MDGLRSALDDLVTDVTPLGDLDQAIAQVADERRRARRVATVVAAVIVLAVMVTGTAVLSGRDAGAPEPAEPVEPLQLGGPPLTPYWHDGVLHVGSVEIETPWRRSPAIEVAGDTILAGDYGHRGVDPAWALVDGDRLEPVPVPDMYPRLSLDGRIAYWWTYPTADSTRVVTWDTETNRELAVRDLTASERGGSQSYLAGIDEDGMAYWVDEASEVPVTRWDVRADTVQPMPGLTSSDIPAPYEPTGEFFQNQFVSPDGTKEVFTGDAPGDPDTIMPCCRTLYRVRPVGSEDPSDLVVLRVPESRLNQPLYDVETGKGSLGAWWETNETVLVTVVLESGPTWILVRCSVSDGACARVLELEPEESGLIDWSFAHFPTTG